MRRHPEIRGSVASRSAGSPHPEWPPGDPPNRAQHSGGCPRTQRNFGGGRSRSGRAAHLVPLAMLTPPVSIVGIAPVVAPSRRDGERSPLLSRARRTVEKTLLFLRDFPQEAGPLTRLRVGVSRGGGKQTRPAGCTRTSETEHLVR